jgi:hypothetical protein
MGCALQVAREAVDWVGGVMHTMRDLKQSVDIWFVPLCPCARHMRGRVDPLLLPKQSTKKN